MATFIFAKLTQAVKFFEAESVSQSDKSVLKFRQFCRMFLIISKFTVANGSAEKAWEIFFALDVIFSLLLWRKSERDNFYIGILQIKPRGQVVYLIDDEDEKIFQRFKWRLQENGKTVYRGLLHVFGRDDVAGREIHDNCRGRFILRESVANNVRRSSARAAEFAFDESRIDIGIDEIAEIFYRSDLECIVESAQVVIENYILITCVLEKIIQILSQTNYAAVFRILVRIQHVAFQNNQRLDLREQLKFLVPFRDIIVHAWFSCS